MNKTIVIAGPAGGAMARAIRKKSNQKKRVNDENC
jgi:hypothetical protein